MFQRITPLYHIISFEGSANTATTCKNGQITFYTNYDGNIGNNILDYNQAKATLFHFSKSTIAKLNKSDNIYYKTNLFGIFMQENGNKIPLSIPRNILTINPSNSLIVQNNSSLTINNYGKLQNKGNIIVKSGSAIYAQAVSETAASNSWNNVPSNLDDVAIDNNNGTIKLESGSIIDDVDKNNSKHPIIIGGTVDISDLIKLDGSQIKLKNSDIIKTGFYNTTIKLFPDDFNISNISTSGFTQIFQNIKFYSDNNGTVRHSTILVPSIVKLQENTDNANVTKYGTDKPVVVVVSPVSIGNILKLFYSTSDVNKILALDEKVNVQLKIESSGRTISIYDFLNNPSSFGITSESYAVDLSSFGIEGTSIDYSKLNDTSILNKVQFVVNKKLDILPKPSGSTELTIWQEFNNYPGVLILNPSITKLIISNKKQ